MINPYPFFGFSPFRRPYPYHYYNSLHNINIEKQNYVSSPSSPSVFSKHQSKNLQNSNAHQHENLQNSNASTANIPDSEYKQDECFEFFGLKLHFDDLLLIALLFFLYQEDVKDSYLYVALILLLLS